MESVGLSEKRDMQAKNLSHGDQRRLGIAMALATDLIESIQDDRGLTLLLIEHDMNIVLSISDRITVLDKGRVLATGTPAEIQDNDAVQEAYLGGMEEDP